MINISKKNISHRRACVMGSIYVGRDLFFLIKNKKLEKGDPLILAEIAGINAAKNTSNLLLLCHQINIENIFINVIMDERKFTIDIYCIVFANSKTGVEMEAMCGVNIALLTIYDLAKKKNPFIIIKDIKLLFKDGGENGLILGSVNDIPNHLKKFFFDTGFLFNNISIILFTISDRAASGRYKNMSGQVLLDFFKIKNADIICNINIPDDKDILLNVLQNCVNRYSPKLIITSGGTGLSKKDFTTSVLHKVCDKLVFGIGELLRFHGSIHSSMSWLSQSISGIYGNSLIVSLPGNPSAVFEGLNILQHTLIHAVDVIKK